MVNLKDVAKEAGTSIATVSRYINKKGFISKELKALIKDVIERTGYKPNLVARNLKLKQSRTIGLIFADIENPAFVRFIKKVEEIAFKKGYSVILCISENNTKKEKAYIETLKGKQVDGYIIVPTSSQKKENYMSMQNENTIFFDRYSNIDNEICVKVDNIKGSMSAVNYLINLGHKNIGIINIPMEITPGVERFEGYKRALIKNNIPINPELIKYIDFSMIESSFEQTRELMNIKNKPTAIFATSIMVSIGVIKYLNKAGINIPEDISFIGFDELYYYSELMSLKPTIIRHPIENLAALSVETLLKKINKKNIDRTTLILEPKLIIGNSCKKIN